MQRIRDICNKIFYALPDLVRALRIIRAPLVMTIFASVVFTLPPQTLETYRVMVQDIWINYVFQCEGSLFSSSCDRWELSREALLSLLGAISICGALFYV